MFSCRRKGREGVAGVVAGSRKGAGKENKCRKVCRQEAAQHGHGGRQVFYEICQEGRQEGLPQQVEGRWWGR